MAYGDIRQLSPHQRAVVGEIIRQGRKRYRRLPVKERRKAIDTALAVGYTESRYRNLPGGDRDSQGWRQERAMYYKNPRNLPASVKRFYDEYDADADKRAPLGVRAQQVQQSGTPRVWDTLAPLARRVREDFTRGGTAPRGGSRGGPRGRLTPVKVSRDPVEPGGEGMATLLRAMQSQQQPQSSTPLTPPAFSAKAPLPRGYQELSSGPPQAPPLKVDDLLEAAKGLDGGDVPRSRVTGGDVVPGGGAPRGGPAVPKGGKLTGRPSDRAGVPTNPKLIELVRRASAWGDVPIQLGTGSNHSKMTASGNVSDHWSGNGIDLPATGGHGDRIAGAVLVQLGVPRKRARQMAQRGGGFTIHRNGVRYQVIWKTAAGSPYGDHTDHVHIGRGR